MSKILHPHPSGMKHAVRYQAAIFQDDHLLLLKVCDHAGSGRMFWVIPGGGQQAGESEDLLVDIIRQPGFFLVFGVLFIGVFGKGKRKTSQEQSQGDDARVPVEQTPIFRAGVPIEKAGNALATTR